MSHFELAARCEMIANNIKKTRANGEVKSISQSFLIHGFDQHANHHEYLTNHVRSAPFLCLPMAKWNFTRCRQFHSIISMMTHSLDVCGLDVSRKKPFFSYPFSPIDLCTRKANIYIPNLNTSDDKEGIFNELIKNETQTFPSLLRERGSDQPLRVGFSHI
jgi:hypothetical protein